MRDRADIERLLEPLARRSPAPDCQAEYYAQGELSTRFAENAITQNAASEQEGVSLSVAFGTRHGGSSTNGLDKRSLGRLVETAERVARASPEDPEYVPPLDPHSYCEDPVRFRSEVLDLGPAAVADAVREAIEPALSRDYKASGLFAVGWGVNAIANSRGLFAFDRYTYVDYSLTVHGPQGSGHAETYGESLDGISPHEIGLSAFETAAAAQNPREIEPGEYTVIFEPRATLDIMEFMVGNLTARDADEGVSAFSGKLGQRLFSDLVTITTETDAPGLPAPPFGENGLPLRRTVWVQDGVLQRLRHTRYWAKRKGVEPDAALFPVVMQGSDRSVQDLVADCRRGLLVKRLWYIRYVDRKELLLTGMTRDGLFLIENGRVVCPVRNLRFNESPLVFLQNTVGLSRAQRVGPWAEVPGAMSEGFTFSSKTESL